MKVILIFVLLAGVLCADETIHSERQALVHVFAKILNQLLTGFDTVEIGSDKECDYFPEITESSDADISLFTKQLKTLMCNSNLINKFSGRFEDANLQQLTCVTEFNRNYNKDKSKQALTKKEEPTTAVKGYIKKPSLYVADQNELISIYDFSDNENTFELRGTFKAAEKINYMLLDATREHLILLENIGEANVIQVFNLDFPRVINPHEITFRPKKITYEFDFSYLKSAVFDSTNRYLLIQNVNDQLLMAFEMTTDGQLTLKATHKSDASFDWLSMTFYPKAKGILALVYTHPNKVKCVKFDSTSATFTELKEVYEMPNLEPIRTIEFSNDGKFMYAACADSNLYTFEVTVDETSDDVIKVVKKEIVIKIEERESNNYNDVKMIIHPNGTFLYLTKLYTDVIYMFKIDTTTGQLSDNGKLTFDKNSVADIVISTDGTKLIVVYDDDYILVYLIDRDNGKLPFQPKSIKVENITMLSFA